MREDSIDAGDRSDSSDITRREVPITLGVLAGAVATGAAGWGFLEGMAACGRP